MPKILTTNAIVRCPHGLGVSIPTDPKCTINGGIVLLHGDSGTLPTCFNLPPCATYQLQSLGLNATKVDGRNVMLVTDFIVTATGYPCTATETHQIIDDSTLVPIPPGQTAPPLPPELQSTDQPTVTGAPGLAFSLAGFANTGNPTSLMMTFTVQSQFPRKWILFMISDLPTSQSRDITAGEPPNIVVAPSSGAWPGSGQITVTLLGSYMATLAPTFHRFVLTAVNHRGLWGSTEIILTVST
jgi:hypothetical protein